MISSVICRQDTFLDDRSTTTSLAINPAYERSVLKAMMFSRLHLIDIANLAGDVAFGQRFENSKDTPTTRIFVRSIYLQYFSNINDAFRRYVFPIIY